MIIGVDAGALSISDERLKVGVWRVTCELLKQLSRLDRKNTYKLYSFSPIPQPVMKQFGSSMENVVLSPSPGYMKFRLPLELIRRPVDIFIGLSQALPYTTNSYIKKVGCIYDLAFLHMGKSYGSSYHNLKEQTKEVVKRAHHLVAISKFSKTDLVNTYDVPDTKITVIYPGITYRSDSCAQSPRRNPYILFVGALKPAKQIPLAIKGFNAFLTKTKKQYDFLLVGGDYWLDPEIKSTIQFLHLSERVFLVGHVSDDTLPSYYRHASAFLTLGSWEGFCMPAVEAMAYGTPVIYAASGATPEIVETAGVPVNPANAEEVGHALRKITEHASFRLGCIQKGKERASQFSWERFGKQWLQLIHTI